jgi:TnpA family transposase
MSTDRDRPSAERKPTARVRPSKLVLPVDPGDEELARDWTLSEADKAEVRRCRGDTNRRRFALQLCTLRNYGRFLDDYDLVPVRILTHLGRQLDLPPVLFIAAPDRDATVSEHEQRIRQYLGYQQFDYALQERLTLAGGAGRRRAPADRSASPGNRPTPGLARRTSGTLND